jgi:phage gp46-like protein
MFDLATRPQPNTSSAAAVFGVPFDLRLVQPSAPRAYPWTDFQSPTGAPQPAVDVLASYAVDLEDTLSTAVILSLFTDRRAGPDDALPLRETNRRGWVGDELAGALGEDQWGSGLWLCAAGKATADTLERARFAAQEALAWLVRDGIASHVTVTAEWVGERSDRLAVRPRIFQPGQEQPVYDVLWGTSIRRSAT